MSESDTVGEMVRELRIPANIIGNTQLKAVAYIIIGDCESKLINGGTFDIADVKEIILELSTFDAHYALTFAQENVATGIAKTSFYIAYKNHFSRHEKRETKMSNRAFNAMVGMFYEGVDQLTWGRKRTG